MNQGALPFAIALGSASLMCALAASGQAPSAPAASAPAASAPAASVPSASVPPASAPKSDGACVERIPSGKARPKVTEKIAPNAVSGHAQLLELQVEHGSGENVLPTGFRSEPGSPETRALEATGFVVPDPSGPAAPQVERKQEGDRATTTVKLYFVPLPKKPGRNSLVLPPVPIAIARASGEIMTICTSPHELVVEDPIANEPNPKPKANPPPRRQLEEWTLAKQITIAAAIALVVGALAAWFIGRWLKRPKPLPPPPPPRPPWEVAMEGLLDIRHAGLLESQRQAEYYDRVSDVVRRYLGDRYGYDGLESTTREALMKLDQASLSLDMRVRIQRFMQDADLVKFARRTPSDAECTAAIEAAETIVKETKPEPVVAREPRDAAPPNEERP